MLYKEVEPIRQQLYRISKLDVVIAKFPDDPAAQKILLEERLDAVTKLRTLIFGELFNNNRVYWIYQGQLRVNESYRELNAGISEIARQAYSGVPVFRNEMVNKEQLSSPILTARKALLKDILENADQEDLGYPKKRSFRRKKQFI